jgi:cation:H+ antiporter
MTTVTLINLVSGILLLSFGGEALVRGAVSTGIRMGLTPMAAGLTIVAFGTSMPELLVNVRAALIHAEGLAVGNIVGSNIANVGLILGVSVLIRPINLDVRVVRNDVYFMVAATAITLLTLMDGVISRVEGLMLLIGIVFYIAYNLRAAKRAREESREKFKDSLPIKKMSFLRSGLFVVAGLLLLSAGGYQFVKGAVMLAESMGVSPAIIGLTVVAVGTSMPELAASVVAAFRGYGDLAIGNVVGSNIFNLLFVLGLTAMILPLQRADVSNQNLLVMLAFTLYFIRLMHIGAKVARWEGLLLLVGFCVYVTSLIM